jgi:hypothetical protein
MALLFSCAHGQVRHVEVEPLLEHPVDRLQVTVAPEVPYELRDALGQSASAAAGALQPLKERHGTLQVQLTTPSATADELQVQANLLDAEGHALGFATWRANGAPSLLAGRAGTESVQALEEAITQQALEAGERRAGDERLFFTPTANTRRAGSFFVSNDELLLFRLGVGLGSRVQLDFWAGGLPIPAAGAMVLPPFHMVGVAGGAGLLLGGMVDLGLKVRVVDEGRYVPAIALSYDLLDVFVAGIGGGALLALGNDVAAGVAAGAGGLNLQFNVFTLTATKHLGHAQVSLGSYLLDNHHWLPQSASVVGVAAGGTTQGGGITADTQTVPLPMLPVQLQPFASLEYRFGPRFSLATELLPRLPIAQSMISTGARWLLGPTESLGPIAVDRIRFKIDVSMLWFLLPPSAEHAGYLPGYVPWVGLGVYFG